MWFCFAGNIQQSLNKLRNTTKGLHWSMNSAMFQPSMYTLYNKNQVPSHTGSEISVQLASQFESFVISLCLLVCGLSIPSINCNDLCRTSVKQRHQHVCLIWRKSGINVDDFSESSESKTEVKAIIGLVAHVPSYTSWHGRGLELMRRSRLQVRIPLSKYF
jgi:hypothetical protein